MLQFILLQTQAALPSVVEKDALERQPALPWLCVCALAASAAESQPDPDVCLIVVFRDMV